MADNPGPKDPMVGRTIEKCRILSPIARGGMGVVYLAEHTSLHRRVALKVLPSELAGDHTYITRFLREAVSAARLEHPNIVQVYDVGKFEQAPFIVMQYVEGFTVAELLERADRFTPQESARVAREVALGLAAAHAQGIVHRDIKPQNILVSSQGEVRISDFGIALDAESSAVSLTQGLVLGTPSYLSPEQAQGQRADARSDLYSLGATIYAMLTGHPPFSGDSPMAVLHKHVYDPVRRPSALAKDIPRFLDDIVMRLLAKKPEDRYQTAEEAAHELDRVVQGNIPRARPEPLRTVPRRTERHVVVAEPPRRKPPGAAIAAIGAAAVLLVAGLFFVIPRKKDIAEPPPEAAAPPPPEDFPPPASKETPLVEKSAPVPEPPPPAAILEPDFEALYRSPADIGLWNWSPGLAKNVSFLPEAIRVSLPATDTPQPEFLFLKASDLEEFTWRFHLRVDGKCPQVCVSRDLPNPGWALVGNSEDFPQKSWQAVELDVTNGQARFMAGGRTEALDPKTGPWQVGFLCPPGTEFEIRNPRLLVRKRHVETAEAPTPAPPPLEKPAHVVSTEPLPPPVPVAPDPGIIPPAALQAIRAHNYPQAAEALAGVAGENPRKLLERVEAAGAVLRAAARSLRPGADLSLTLRGGVHMSAEFVQADEKELTIGIGGGRASYPWSQLHPDFIMSLLKDNRSAGALEKALFLLLEDDPVGALEQLGPQEAPGHREEMEDLALERVDPLLKDGKLAEAQALMKRLKPLMTGPERIRALTDREERAELAAARTDLERARILLRQGKPAQAEALITPLFKNARTHEVSALCQMLREAVLAQPARDLFDGATLQGWNFSPGGERAFRATDGVISASASATGVALLHEQIPPTRALQFELKVRSFHGSGMVGLGILQRGEGDHPALVFSPLGIVLTEPGPGQWKERARKAVTVAGGAWFRVDLIVSDGQAFIFLDGTLFWRGPSVEPSAVGFGTAFFFQNADADLRNVRIGVPAEGR